MMQLAIVIIILALAGAYTLRRLYRTIKDGPSCDCGNTSCSHCHNTTCRERKDC